MKQNFSLFIIAGRNFLKKVLIMEAATMHTLSYPF